MLRLEKDRYRSKAGDRKYVPAHDTDKLLEKIIAQLLPEFLRLESEFRKEAEQQFLDPRFPDKQFLDKQFLERIRDQVETLQRMVGDEDDSLVLRHRDDRRKSQTENYDPRKELGSENSGPKKNDEGPQMVEEVIENLPLNSRANSPERVRYLIARVQTKEHEHGQIVRSGPGSKR